MDVETLFQMAEQQYRTLLEEGSWVKRTKKGSGFMAGTICWICKKEGHLARNCLTKDQEEKAGKGPGGGSKKQGNGKDGKQKPWRKPPGPGEPEERMYKGRKEFYCARCKCWNPTHPTPQHKTKAELTAAGQANNANPSPAPAPAPSPTPAPSLPVAGSASSANAQFLTNGFS